MRSIRHGLLSLAAIGFATAAHAAPSPQDTTSVTLAESGDILPNPERGFYRAGQANLEEIAPASLEAAFQQGYRLIYARINLEPYRTRALPADYLAKLDAGFAAARRAGVKLIVRAVYNYPRGETEYRDAKDASLKQVLAHLAQLKPVLAANSDVIAFLQAGFVGAWGEWHTSSNRLTEPAARTAIKDALLAAAPDGRFVQFRYPPYIQEWTSQLPPATAPLARGPRIGFHNDCFLASRTDVGTYNEEAAPRAAEQDHMDRLGDIAPFGGETCNPADDPGATPRTGCADILAEGARYNLTYLNADYYRRMFHDAWAAQGCLDEVTRRMGYRLRLIDAAHRSRATPGESLNMSVSVRNDGWARPFNPRGVEVVLRGRATGAELRLPAPGIDPRDWLPGAQARVALGVFVPGNAKPDTYDVLLAFPDPSTRLRTDPRYAIRPANAEDAAHWQGWDSARGAFRLGTSVVVARR